MAVIDAIGTIVLEFAQTDDFARIAEIRGIKIKSQHTVLTRFINTEEKEEVTKALIAEKEILERFTKAYVRNAERMLELLENYIYSFSLKFVNIHICKGTCTR